MIYKKTNELIFSKFDNEMNVTKNNYGIIDIYPTKLEISIKNENMSVLENYTIPIK